MVEPPVVSGGGDGWRSARRRRSRSSAAKRGAGSTGTTGRWSWANGSVIAAPGGDVRAAEGGAGADEQRLRGMDRALEEGGDLRHGQVVQVAQGEGGPVLRGEPVEHLLGTQCVEPDVPGILGGRAALEQAQ